MNNRLLNAAGIRNNNLLRWVRELLSLSKQYGIYFLGDFSTLYLTFAHTSNRVVPEELQNSIGYGINFYRSS